MVMDVQKLETLPPPPGVIGSLRAGFDIVSNRVALILVPLVLDVFLWLGPRLSVNKLLSPFVNFMFDQARRGMDTATLNEFVSSRSLILGILQKFNLFSLLSKLQLYPIGISSLSAETLPVANPVGSQNVLDISSSLGFVGLSFFLVMVGWIFGGLYFRLVSGSILGEDAAGIGFTRAVVQTLFLSVIWTVALMVVLIPATMLIGLVGLISPWLASIVLLVIAFFSFWLIVPFFFMPHGIFVRGQNALYSIFSSLRMTRFTLPTSGMFVLSVFLLSRGLNYLWSVPDSDSWLALVGYAGHAFITTALLAASFVYYRDMNNWLQHVFERLQSAGKPPSIKQA
ncbi:MAG: hypothetical protein C3F07_02085 [Anaerolineales bacterium]|nr:MAG: hypothetical protein C3F07_02085 [Anaerolineales bacterium]